MTFSISADATFKPGARAAMLEAAFDRAVASRVPGLRLRPERTEDDAFLLALFIACSPVAGLLPPAMLQQQAELQLAGHRREYPRAMRRLVSSAAAPIGHVILDWGGGNRSASWCIDIALLPAYCGRGFGGAVLAAWLEAADAGRCPTGLTVRRDNPARRLYARLGFLPVADADPDAPTVTLLRAVGG